MLVPDFETTCASRAKRSARSLAVSSASRLFLTAVFGEGFHAVLFPSKQAFERVPFALLRPYSIAPYFFPGS